MGYHVIRVGKETSSVRTLCVVAGNVWAAYKNCIVVVDGESLQIVVGCLVRPLIPSTESLRRSSTKGQPSPQYAVGGRWRLAEHPPRLHPPVRTPALFYLPRSVCSTPTPSNTSRTWTSSRTFARCWAPPASTSPTPERPPSSSRTGDSGSGPELASSSLSLSVTVRQEEQSSTDCVVQPSSRKWRRRTSRDPPGLEDSCESWARRTRSVRPFSFPSISVLTEVEGGREYVHPVL